MARGGRVLYVGAFFKYAAVSHCEVHGACIACSTATRGSVSQPEIAVARALKPPACICNIFALKLFVCVYFVAITRIIVALIFVI